MMSQQEKKDRTVVGEVQQMSNKQWTVCGDCVSATNQTGRSTSSDENLVIKYYSDGFILTLNRLVLN